MMEKSELRLFLRKQRQDFVKYGIYFPFSIPSELQKHLDIAFRNATYVAGYLPVGSEADIRAAMTSYADKGIHWCLPWLATKDAEMVFRAWQPNDVTETAPGGFQQPLSSADAVAPDFVLLPLLGFDALGTRLGQGAGHYDRALERLPTALRIGIGWSVQQVSQLPADPWDLPLDAILTEKEWIVPPSSRLIGN